MIVKFTQDKEINDRLYLAGESRGFDAATAKKLIDDGVAVDPENAKAVAAPTAKKTAGK